MPNLLDNLFYPQIWHNDAKVVDAPQAIEIVDPSGEVAVSTVDGRTRIDLSTFAGTGGPLSDATPQPVAAAGDAGVSAETSRADHVHAHGNQTGETLHALATADLHGFMSSADKSALDTLIRSDATPASVAAAGAPGVALTLARGDHVHAHGNQSGGSTHALATTSVAGFLSSADKGKLDDVLAWSPASAFGTLKALKRGAGMPVAKIDGTAQADDDAVPFISLASCGAVGDGTLAGGGTDDTAAFQLAITKALLTGATQIRLDTGRNYRLTSRLDFRKLATAGIPGGIQIVGCGASDAAKSFLIFDVADRSPDTTSTTSINFNAGGDYVLTCAAHTPLPVGVIVSAKSRGSNVRAEGFVLSDNGVTLTMRVQYLEQIEGSGGAQSDWDIVNQTENFLISAGGAHGARFMDFSIVSRNTGFRGAALSLEHDPISGADTGMALVEHVYFFGLSTAGLDMFDCLRLNNNIGTVVRQCKFQRAGRGVISGNGANAILDCTTTHMHRTGYEVYGYACRIEGCTAEPDSDLTSPTFNRCSAVRAYGQLGPLSLVLINNIWNDAPAGSTGRAWVECNGVAVIVAHGNYIGDESATRAAYYLQNGCQVIDIEDFIFAHAVVEWGPGSVNGAAGHIQIKPWYTGTTPMIGTNYYAPHFNWLGANSVSWPGAGSHFGFTHTDFASFQFGTRDVPASKTVANGVNNDISITAASLVLTGPTAAFSLNGFSYAGAGDGQRFRVIYAGAQQLTLAHESGTTASYRTLLPGGADIVYPAGGGPWVLDFVRDQTVSRWRLASAAPVPAGIQRGTTTLVAGVSPAIAATITANSRITCTLHTPAGTALTITYAALAGDRVVGAPGSFKISALLAAGTVDAANTSSLDWMVIS